ncbi:MAG TPA: lysophospholipid acyltransferase family protein [Candidatus Thermoplasmatota archaeon]|nr:lysophospholipid acyltransferase family protein [Candidatus Thermoplasmatota archaeon]
MGKAFYRVSYYTLGAALRAAFRIRMNGREHIPKTGPGIIASNHFSYADHFLTPAKVPRQIFYISKAQHFDHKVQGWLFKQWGVIPLKRGAGDQGAFNQALEILREGNLFGIFPEGTRSTDGKVHKGHTGVIRMALMTGAPIIPVGMTNSDVILPKNKSWPKFKKCVINVGEPWDLSQYKGRENDRELCRALTDELMRKIAALAGREYVDDYTPVADYQKKSGTPQAPPATPAAPEGAVPSLKEARVR